MGVAGQPDWWWSAAMSATLVLRRTAPMYFATAATFLSLAHVLTGASLLFPGDAVLLVAAYAVAAYTHGRVRLIGPALGLIFIAVFTHKVLISARLTTPGEAGLVICLFAVSFVAAWAVGLLERRRTDALRDAEHRRFLSERDAENRSQLAAYEERERISDEMHDVLAHTLTGIIIQAESGQIIACSSEAADLFVTIATTSRSALLEVRSLLAPTDSCRTKPSPGVRDIHHLLEEFRSSGLQVTFKTTGTPCEVSPGMSLAVYRVIQESLTNALRHGAQNRANLWLDWSPRRLKITVSNPITDTTRITPIEEHRGLGSMRRRCALYGGNMTYAVIDEFTVIASWPLIDDGAM